MIIWLARIDEFGRSALIAPDCAKITPESFIARSDLPSWSAPRTFQMPTAWCDSACALAESPAAIATLRLVCRPAFSDVSLKDTSIFVLFFWHLALAAA